MTKTIWTRGEWVVEYRSDNCSDWSCWGRGGATIEVQRLSGGWTKTCFHSRRFWRRNRSLVECVSLALSWVQEQELAALDEQQEALLAEQEAAALADVVAQLEAP